MKRLVVVALVLVSACSGLSDEEFCKRVVTSREAGIVARNPEAGIAPEWWVKQNYEQCLADLAAPPVEDSGVEAVLGR